MLVVSAKKRLAVCLCASLFFMFFCHGFMLMNPSYNHDSLSEVVRDTGLFQTTLGRFLSQPFRSFFSGVTASWYLGLLTAVMIGCSAWLIADILAFEGSHSLILLSGVLTTNYTIINSVAVYLPWLDVYGASLLLSVLSLWLVLKWRFGFLGGIFSVIGVLGLYPPYIICIPSLVLIWLVLSIRKRGIWKDRFVLIIKTVIMFLLAYGIYHFLLDKILLSNHLSLADQNNSITAVKFFGFKYPLPILLEGTVKKYFQLLFTTLQYFPHPQFIILFLILVFVLAFVTFILFTRPSFIEMLCSVLLVALIPFIFNITYILCEEAIYHPLMTYSVYLIYIIPIGFYDTLFFGHAKDFPTGSERSSSVRTLAKCASCLSQYLIIFAIIAVLFCDMRYANNVYTDKYMRERVTLSFMTRVMGQAEQIEGFVPAETPVMIIGSPSDNLLIAADNSFYPVMNNRRMKTSITYNIDRYLENYMGYSNPYASKEMQEQLIADEAVAQMPSYPQSGFARLINGCLVIKISD